jgi:hypothetical protein
LVARTDTYINVSLVARTDTYINVSFSLALRAQIVEWIEAATGEPLIKPEDVAGAVCGVAVAPNPKPVFAAVSWPLLVSGFSLCDL